ncbi:hypothetical protein HMPREF1261_00624 [Corynebacterium sp. KPL1818]|nr:hypothetical protein HMPREF1261_00624 [Corynebacterium sp. KPL1818]
MTTEPNTRLMRMCHVLKLNRSSFYKWVQTRKKRRLKMYSDAVIGARITTIFDDELGLYGAIFHSDHGSVYTSQAFRSYCSLLGVRQSMGVVGTSADRSPSRIV